MLDIQFVIENRDIVNKAIKDKNCKPVDLERLEELYKSRISLVQIVDAINTDRKKAAEKRDTEQGRALKVRVQEEDKKLNDVSKELSDLLSQIPNIPSPEMPIGRDEDDNIVRCTVGEKKKFNFTPKPHWEIGKSLDIIDNERAAKVVGSRFTYLKGGLVTLQFALIRMTMDTVMNVETVERVIKEKGLSIKAKAFVPVIPPVMITPETYFGMARLEPKEDRFYLAEDNLYLIGSAEHTLGAMHMGEAIHEKDLPYRYIGYSTAFRREAGSYGKDTKGILRQHQFDKIEFEIFSTPESSREEHELLVGLQEHLVQLLDLPYQVVSVCTGDTAVPNQTQTDIEIFMPGQDTYRETHSADHIGGYQARRLGAKVIREDGSREVLHTNDATAFAIGRTLISIIENYQNEDGSITVPEALVPYTGGMKKIEKTRL